MKSLVSAIILAISSLFVAPAFGLPITGTPQPNIVACSGEIENTLACRKWPETNPDQLMYDQKNYLQVNSYKLPDCKPFEYAMTKDECVMIGKKSAVTVPVEYINHLCELLH
ncbi:hypothetical protein TWF694_009446 [Orbilia ellipsospora]|uniref:Uncharacterized protein n=1 Tax=Orbilia ellipsospora TaxID=2528407 RepID=A0AAV9XDI2_9PEZI